MYRVLGLLVIAILTLPAVAHADNTVNIQTSSNSESDVSVQSNTGQNTICQNGQCTTTTNNGHSTACVNGKCYESDSGTLKVESHNGTTTVDTGNSQSSSPDSDNTIITPQVNVTMPEPASSAAERLKHQLKHKKNVAKPIPPKVEKYTIKNFFETEWQSLLRFFHI